MMKKIFFIIALLLSFECLAGLKVVDGDSLELNGKKIRLMGIDAPEFFQECYDQNGQTYFCGQRAKDFLQKMIDDGRRKGFKVKCVKKDIDRYKRDLSICKIGDVNLNRNMVKSGWAVSYKHDMYEKEENKAKKQQRGIWQGKFMRPELYRILERYRQNEKNITK